MIQPLAVALMVAGFCAVATLRVRRAGGDRACDVPVAVASLAAAAVVAALRSPAWPALPALSLAAASASTDAAIGYVLDDVLAVAVTMTLVAVALQGSAEQAMIGACVTAAPFAVMAWLSRGRAIGAGDVKLSAAIGLGLGARSGLTSLWWAAMFGGVAAATMLVSGKRKLGAQIRFAPFIALGAFTALLWGAP